MSKKVSAHLENYGILKKQNKKKIESSQKMTCNDE